MIGSLRGEVVERSAGGTALVEVGGVGYVVHVSPKTLAELEPTSSTFLFVHHHIREDAQTLYGFLTRDERSCFQALISTHGIGPAMAMAILSTHAPRSLVDIVASGDVASLTLVPGVGKKTAERLLVELKGKFALSASAEVYGAESSSIVTDVREALVGLGYDDREIREALTDLDDSDRASNDASVLLKAVLGRLGTRRA